MPEVHVCAVCHEEIDEERQKYVVTSRNQYNVETRVHAECLKRKDKPAAGPLRPRPT